MAVLVKANPFLSPKWQGSKAQHFARRQSRAIAIAADTEQSQELLLRRSDPGQDVVIEKSPWLQLTTECDRVGGE